MLLQQNAYVESKPAVNFNHMVMSSRVVFISPFSVNDVFEALKASKNSFTSGVDGVPSFLLKN